VITLPSFYADFDEGKVRCSVDVERILRRLVERKSTDWCSISATTAVDRSRKSAA
jgi:hypothetical protein